MHCHVSFFSARFVQLKIAETFQVTRGKAEANGRSCREIPVFNAAPLLILTAVLTRTLPRVVRSLCNKKKSPVSSNHAGEGRGKRPRYRIDILNIPDISFSMRADTRRLRISAHVL